LGAKKELYTHHKSNQRFKKKENYNIAKNRNLAPISQINEITAHQRIFRVVVECFSQGNDEIMAFNYTHENKKWTAECTCVSEKVMRVYPISDILIPVVVGAHSLSLYNTGRVPVQQQRNQTAHQIDT
jgi:tRNA(Leu) C34 or U34 (ribose-2'-O)-methylase TrmL